MPRSGRNGGIMTLLYHKLLLFLLILPALFPGEISTGTIAALLTAVSAGALCSYLDQRRVLPVLLGFWAACTFRPSLFPFLPLTAYDCMDNQRKWIRCLPALSLIRSITLFDPLAIFQCSALCVLAVFLCFQRQKYERLLLEYHQVRDDTAEAALLLREKNLELLKNQDYEVELATLAERNRIAREIHDNVGHLLTRSILQVSALLVTYTGSQEQKDQISAVKDTLVDAMDNVRQSVHNLHEESLDLKQQITRLIRDFAFCPVKLVYDSGRLSKEMNYAVIAIVKEALSNIARHSNATNAVISILEHPSLYQIQISDNGSSFKRHALLSASQGDGMGISNMEERVRSLHGIFHIDYSNGFKIFISIPKLSNEVKKCRLL